MKKRAISILFVVCLALTFFSVAHADECGKEGNEKAPLPPNLILSRHARVMVEKVWRRSPAFRLQCERISQAQWLKVKLKIVLNTSLNRKYRAVTNVNRGLGLASVEIHTPHDFVELIGHEFEHVLEQIECLNLAALVAEENGQASRHSDGSFETERALRAGRKVKAEYRRAKSLNDSAEEPGSTRITADVTGGGRHWLVKSVRQL